jgi:polyphenol oxidase
MTIIPFSFPGLPNIQAAFTTRLGGVSQGPYAEANLSWEVGDEDARVLANRLILQRRLGFDRWFETRQVHGVEMIIDPGQPDSGSDAAKGAETDNVSPRPPLKADGSTTSRPGLALIVKTADCQPILLAHRGGGHVAALHCGWRGNRLGFPQKGVAAFCQAYGLRPEDILAVRGPSLGPTASEFVNFDLEWGDAFRDYFTSICVSDCFSARESQRDSVHNPRLRQLPWDLPANSRTCRGVPLRSPWCDRDGTDPTCLKRTYPCKSPPQAIDRTTKVTAILLHSALTLGTRKGSPYSSVLVSKGCTHVAPWRTCLTAERSACPKRIKSHENGTSFRRP